MKGLCQKANLEDRWAKRIKRKFWGLLNIWPPCDLVLVHICHPKAVSENHIKLMCRPSVTELQSLSPFARLKFNHKLNYIASRTFICFPHHKMQLSIYLCPHFTLQMFFTVSSQCQWRCCLHEFAGLLLFFIHCRPASILVNTWNQLPQQSLNLAHMSGKHLCKYMYFSRTKLALL